ncbi:MAG: class I SAM-dependent methyltransferase [Emcibacter sp.]|nr:class I SAM-dependent methyltransferase [Emcibacter sp.]
MSITPIRNILYLPLGIFYFLLSFPLFIINLLIPKGKYIEIQTKSAENERAWRLSDIGDFIQNGDRVLDVGCGNGRFGEAIAKKYNGDVRGVDVVNYANATIPIDFYDGYVLPFEDNSFDVIVMAFMLHHVKHQDKIFSEAIRCSRRGIIVYEDTYFSPWQWAFTVWNDFYSNMAVGTVKIVKGLEGKGIWGMPLPFTFRSFKGWQKYFAEKGLSEKSVILHHGNIKPHTKATFLLEK